jgi:hypothetical protein
VRDAKEGGVSLYASSLKVHEIIAREHPEYLAVLERGFRCDRRGEEAPEDDSVTPYRVPVFSERDGVLSTRFVRGVIDRGAAALGEPLSDFEKDALDFLEEVARRDEVLLELTLRPGEASFINNYEMLHARTAFVDHDDPAKKRLLYRLWLEGDPSRPMRRGPPLPEPLRPHGRRPPTRPGAAVRRARHQFRHFMRRGGAACIAVAAPEEGPI